MRQGSDSGRAFSDGCGKQEVSVGSATRKSTGVEVWERDEEDKKESEKERKNKIMPFQGRSTVRVRVP